MSNGLDFGRAPARILRVNDTTSGNAVFINSAWIVVVEVVQQDPMRILLRLGMDTIQLKRGQDLVPVLEMTGADAENFVKFLEAFQEGNFDGNLYTDQLPPP